MELAWFSERKSQERVVRGTAELIVMPHTQQRAAFLLTDIGCIEWSSRELEGKERVI